MAVFKSMISFQAAGLLLVVLTGLALVQTQTAEAQQGGSCVADLSRLNVCAPFVVPGSNSKPNSDCCSAIQALENSCLCDTLRIAAQIPTQCNLPPLSCGLPIYHQTKI